MQLGVSAQITIGTSNLEASVAFYQKIGFRKVSSGSLVQNWVKLTDDCIYLVLVQRGDAFIAMGFVSEDLAMLCDELECEKINFIQNLAFEKVFLSPDDHLLILLQSKKDQGLSNEHKTLLDIEGSSEELPNKQLGVFGEYSLPVQSLDKAITFYKKMGFTVHHQIEYPYPWAVIYAANTVIGLHHQDQLRKEYITYYTTNIEAKAKELEAMGINVYPVYDYLDEESNIYKIDTPEGQQIIWREL